MGHAAKSQRCVVLGRTTVPSNGTVLRLPTVSVMRMTRGPFQVARSYRKVMFVVPIVVFAASDCWYKPDTGLSQYGFTNYFSARRTRSGLSSLCGPWGLVRPLRRACRAGL